MSKKAANLLKLILTLQSEARGEPGPSIRYHIYALHSCFPSTKWQWSNDIFNLGLSYKTIFILNPVEHEILNAHKIIKEFGFS